MIEVDALDYEYLLRRIYNVGRHGTTGADADIYRRMERAKVTYDMNIENAKKKLPLVSTLDDKELLYRYRKECIKVWTYVSSAIHEGLRKFSNILSDEEKEILQQVAKEPKEINKEYVDNAIQIAEDIFVKHKIFPG